MEPRDYIKKAQERAVEDDTSVTHQLAMLRIRERDEVAQGRLNLAMEFWASEVERDLRNQVALDKGETE